MATRIESVPATRDDIADLITRRALPTEHIDHLDPFLFLNHHGPQVYPPQNHGLPFGPHPHRGFETVTFILEGDIAHKDSGGHESVIGAGGVQWMTAGHGLIHSETSSAAFKNTGGPLEILQLWVNLPARLKMTEPKYVGLQKNQIPQISEDHERVKIELVAGKWKDRVGAFQPLTDITLMILRLTPDGYLDLPIAAGHTVFFYVVRGEVEVTSDQKNSIQVRAFHLLDFDSSTAALSVKAKTESVIFFGHALPFGEPIVAHGPFVMNTREEIIQAIQDVQSGRLK